MCDDAIIAKGYLPYNAEADILKSRYAETPFAERHQHFGPFFPDAPAKVMDVGSGIGVDSLGFAELGHEVLSVEPADAMRAVAMEERHHPNITWLSDFLPTLDRVQASGTLFDFILLSASFMHLPRAAQPVGFSTLASLTKPRGTIAMSLRHGPVPYGRTMYEIADEEAMRMAHDAGLNVVHQAHGEGRKIQPGVTWSSFIFRKD
ncbi:MAG: class I SAM-dependent methyltransferase [Parvibaculum sp.]